MKDWSRPKSVTPHALFALCATVATASLLTAAVFSPLAAPVSAAAKETANNSLPAPGAPVVMNFEEVELPVFIKFISKITGRNFVFGEKVGGTVTVISPTPVNADEAYAVFQSVLSVRGLTTIEDGAVTRIVPVKDARVSGFAVFSREPGTGGYTTTLLPLDHVDVAEITGVLSPLVSKEGSLLPYGATNTLIISDTAANIERMAAIVDALDLPRHEQTVEIIPLEHADAKTVAEQINSILTDTVRPRAASGKDRTPAGEKAGFKIVDDDRTNSLIVIATAMDLRKIKALAKNLDTPLAAGDERIRVYYAKHADAEALVNVVASMFGGARPRRSTVKGESKTATGNAPSLAEPLTISSDPATNAVIVNASAQDYRTIESLLTMLDIPRPQVFIEAMLVEVSMDKSTALGFDFQGGGDIGDGVGLVRANLSNLNSAFLNPASLSGLILAATSDRTVRLPDGTEIPATVALFQALAQDTDLNILSAPTLLTLDNQEAEIVVGENIPFITGRAASLVTVENVFTTVERRDVGIKLKVKPQVSEGDVVILEVEEEVSALVKSSLLEESIVGPTTTIRSASTVVSVKDGRTVVIGGLISDVMQNDVSKIPLLGDIPWIGRLFRHEREVAKKVNLIVFLTPHIIRSASDLQRISERKKEEFGNRNTRRTGEIPEHADLEAPPDGPNDAPAAGLGATPGADTPEKIFPNWPGGKEPS